MTILLTLAYDGTAYAGWQRQENAIAVQQRLEEALAALLGGDVRVAGASRTDAGVHALGQRAAFTVAECKVPLPKLPQVLNGFLPEDIVVSAAEAVPSDFNPRFAARWKTYRYRIYNGPTRNPLLCRYSAFVPQALNLEAMQCVATHFVGTHDFKAFCAAGSSAKTTVRTIFDCQIAPGPDEHCIDMHVTGEGFLYNMVRIMAGTAVYAGLGKLEPDSIPQLYATGERSQAGKTMPPQGLTLLEVSYEKL